MKLEQLKCFNEVVCTGSFSGAADNLFITHQAVGKNMKQLEEELGVVLFNRNSKGVSLTLAGEDVLLFVQDVLQKEQKLEESLAQYRKDCLIQKKELRISSSSAVTSVVLPDILAKLYAQDKGVTIKISSSNQFEEIVEALRRNTIQLALLSITENEHNRTILQKLDDLKVVVLARDELVCVARKGSETNLKEKYMATFSITPLDDSFRQITEEHFTVSSVDIEFHKNLLEKMNSVVAMPGLAYQNFFSTKHYSQIDVLEGKMDVLHIAIMRNDADVMAVQIINKVQKELYLK